MRSKPLIIQVAGYEYLSDVPNIRGRKFISAKLASELRCRFTFVRYIDLFDYNKNNPNSVILAGLQQAIIDQECFDIHLFNRILRLTATDFKVKLMQSRTDRIIVIDNSIYDFILDMTIKYMLSFRDILLYDGQIEVLLNRFMDPKTNPFIIELKEILDLYPIDIIVHYEIDSLVQPKGEFTSEVTQDLFDTLYKIKVMSTPMMTYLTNRYYNINDMDLSYSDDFERERMFVDQLVINISKIMGEEKYGNNSTKTRTQPRLNNTTINI